MSGFKKFLIAFSIGAFFGTVAVGYFGVGFLSWYWEPPTNIGLSCRPAVEWALRRLQWLQAGGIFGGGFLFATLFFVFFKKKNEPLEPSLPPAGSELR